MKRRAAFVIAAALVLGVVLGTEGYAAWERSRPRPFYSIDPSEISKVQVQGQAASGHEGGDFYITDREQIERIVELLNGFTYGSTEELEPAMGWHSHLVLFHPNGVYGVFFATGGGTDCIRRYAPDGASTLYYTTPGYFEEIAGMCSDR